MFQAADSTSSTTSAAATATDAADTAPSAAAASQAAASAAAAQASASPSAAAAFALPGKSISVLPIGLGVFAGISVIALIVVGLVTYERTKYRKVRPLYPLLVYPFPDVCTLNRRSGNVDLLNRALQWVMAATCHEHPSWHRVFREKSDRQRIYTHWLICILTLFFFLHTVLSFVGLAFACALQSAISFDSHCQRCS